VIDDLIALGGFLVLAIFLMLFFTFR